MARFIVYLSATEILYTEARKGEDEQRIDLPRRALRLHGKRSALRLHVDTDGRLHRWSQVSVTKQGLPS